MGTKDWMQVSDFHTTEARDYFRGPDFPAVSDTHHLTANNALVMIGGRPVGLMQSLAISDFV